MLLLEKANSALFFIMKLGCTLKFIPYTWNSQLNRFKKPTKWNTRIFYIFSLTPTLLIFGFMVYRGVETIKMSIPPRIRVMNLIWGFAYMLLIIGKIQIYLTPHEILTFANELFCTKEKELILVKAKAEKAREVNLQERKTTSLIEKHRRVKYDGVDWISIIILYATFLLVVNPPAHAAIIFDIPCAPHYFTSLILPCSWTGDNPVSFLELIPYVLIETYLFTDMILVAAFYWILIFLGLVWIKNELIDKQSRLRMIHWRSGSQNQPNGVDYINSTLLLDYRIVQILTLQLNLAFELILKTFPSLIFVLAASLIFCSIRFYHLPFFIYAAYPACSLRCLFDATSQLEAAGAMSLQSEIYLNQIKQMYSQQYNLKASKYIKTFIKSSPKLVCRSGSLYTLEKSIVLVSLHNCIQLVFNLLVGYPKPDASRMTER